MRVVAIASLVAATVVGLTPAAHACSVGSGSGPLSTIGSAVSSTVTYIVNIFYVTNNTTNNATNGTNPTPAQGTQTAQGTQPAQGGGGAGGGTGSPGVAAAVASPAPAMGGGGGVGGGGLSASGFGGSSGIAGLPINPSADLSLPAASMASSSGGTGGGASLLIDDDTPVAQTSGVTFAMAGSQEPENASSGVTIVSTAPAASGSDGPSALPIAAITRATLPGSGSASPSAFVFDGPAAEGPPITPRSWAMLLSGLGGVAVLGAAWAWRSLV